MAIEFAGSEGIVQPTAVVFTKDLGPILKNSTIRQSGGCGVLRVVGVSWSTDFTAPSLGNQFIDNVGPARADREVTGPSLSFG